MSVRGRKTAHFSEMSAAMRRAGSWDLQTAIDRAEASAPPEHHWRLA